jgi:Uma2 family endonuclease
MEHVTASGYNFVMSSIASPILPPRATYTDEPVFRLSVDQYHELIRAGQLTEDDPVELLEGILVFKMPKNTPHTTVCRLGRRAIEPLLPAGYFYDSEQPITLAVGEPEPDGAVVRGRIEDYARAHPGPGDVALVIEVADTSLERDRGIKLRSYARAGIPLYWIVNLTDRQVEVYAQPDSAAEPPTYRGRDIFKEDGCIGLSIGGMSLGDIAVHDLLPPSE